MKITLNGIEVNYDKLKEYVENNDVDAFDTELFSKNLINFKHRLAETDINNLDDLEKKEIRHNIKLVESLSNINKKLEKYNMQSNFSLNEITETKRLVQIKCFIKEYKQLNHADYIKIEGSGIFTLVDMYIVPLSFIDTDFDDDIKMFSNVTLQVVSGVNSYGLPSDVLLGSSRRISKTHFAIIKDSNPLMTRYLNSNKSWRYISAQGEAV